MNKLQFHVEKKILCGVEVKFIQNVPSFHLVPLQALSWTLMLLLTAPNKFLGGKIAHHWNFHNLWKIPLKMRSFVFLLWSIF